MRLELALLAITTFVLRFIFCLHTHFGRDELAIYKKALIFYSTGVLPTTGAEVVYTDTAIPGVLQNILMGLPLFFSNGHPWGEAIAVALFGAAAAVLISAGYRRLFPQAPHRILNLLIFFAPWSIVLANLWNPSFVPFFSALFFWGLGLQFGNERQQFWGSSLIPFSILMIVQLHLSFVVLVAILGLLILLGFLRRFNWTGFALGAALGALGLIPYLLEKTSGSAEFLTANIQFYPERIWDLPKIFFRYLTFPTGETTRFLQGAQGPPEALRTLNENFYLWLPYIIAIAFSVYMIWSALKFYFHNERLHPQKSPQGIADFVVWTAPLLTYFLFWFSVKGPSAHTFWILFPISFYPMFRVWEQKGWPRLWTVVIFLICANWVAIQAYLLQDLSPVKDYQSTELTAPR